MAVDVDWARVATEFHRDRDVIATRTAINASRVDLAEFTGAVEGLVSGPDRDPAAVTAAVRGLWSQAARQPGASFLLGFSLYAEVQHGWELSADTDNMAVLIESVRETWLTARTAVDDGQERALVDLLVRHLGDLLAAFEMENGLNCSCALETIQAAGQVADGTAAVLADLDALTGDAPTTHGVAGAGAAPVTPAGLLRRVLEAHHLYFDGVRLSAQTILEHVLGEVEVEEVEARAAALQQALMDERLAVDVYQSELRAHVMALTALAARLRSTALSGLTFPGLKVTYVVPFTARGATDNLARDNERLVAAVRRHGHRLIGTGPLAPLQVRDLELSDIWSHGRDEVFSEATESELEPTAYQVVTAVLPDLWIQPRAPGLPRLGPYRVEIRFSSFGNHHVRVSGPVQPADDDRPPGYHDLNQALRRGSGFMGAEDVVLDSGGQVHGSVGQLAAAVVEMVSGWDDLLEVRKLRCHVDPAIDTHALITVPEAFVRTPTEPGAPPVSVEATGEQILDAVGPLLLIPAERTAAGLEEWLRYADPGLDADIPNFLGQLAPLDSLAVQTARSTCLYTPGLPDWSLLGTSELVEFVVSSRALIRQWNNHLQEAVDVATTMLRRRLAGESLKTDEVRLLRLRLADHGALIRQQRALLHSEELARSPGHRHILDNLLHTSGASRLEAELATSIGELDELYTQLGDDAAAVEEARTAAYQNLVGLILFVLALFSLADLFGFVNDSVFPARTPTAVVAAELVTYALAIVGLAVWGVIGYRRSTRG
ncbi:hypothetical protein AVL62_13065 [Serinicoccus chungangensis]|uniref:Uncharacterized protein n=1 Tax=Serinicoccus chungangensis TaxID=767452 RepID=A0A0W8I0P9_9MICO|nr:hypothetical protein AVL62_13065 [Serinicoccus chungangensis]